MTVSMSTRWRVLRDAAGRRRTGDSADPVDDGVSLGVCRDRRPGSRAYRSGLRDLGRVRRRPAGRFVADRAAGAAGCDGPVPVEGADVVAGDSAGADDVEELAPVRGRNGKTYLRQRRQQPAIACSICGELHQESPEECPWDLFAQGLGPRPVQQRAGIEDPSHDRKGADVVVEESPG